MVKSRDKLLSVINLRQNLYVLLVWRFLVVMFLFSVSRIAFYLINRGYFPNTTFPGMIRLMQGGLVFDTAAVIYTNLLYFTLFLLPFAYRYRTDFQKVMKWEYLITNGLALMANCIDFIYFQFAFRRSTASIFTEFKHESNLGALLPKFIAGYWYVALIWVALLAVLYFSYGPQLSRKTGKAGGKGFRFVPFLEGTALFVLFGTLMVGGIRGDFKHSTRPITISNAGKYISEPLEANIVLNTPFAVYRTLGKQTFEKEHFFSDSRQVDQVFTPVHQPVVTEPFKNLNVVILIMESFGCEYTKTYSHHLDEGTYEGYTPFLDSLMQHSRIYWQSFANGRKSIDAMPSVLTSIPMMVEPFFLTPYSTDKLNSIASLLAQKGYYSAYFHGAPNGSMGFEAFANATGFKDYFGLNEYGDKKDFDGSWGIWDEPFFQFFARTMTTFREPFVSAIFSVSSHHPFVVPPEYKGKFRQGPQPILQCIGYTDHALRRFFETASKMPWYKNTLFVITGDHTSQSSYLEYKTNLGAFRVPVIFYRPDDSLAGKLEGLAQQIDIMPSILGYLNYDKPYVAFGRDLFHPTGEPYVITYAGNTYQLVMGDYLYLFNGLIETGLYNYRTDILLSKNLKGQLPEVESHMDRMVKAFVQQYNNRLIENRMTVDEKPAGK